MTVVIMVLALGAWQEVSANIFLDPLTLTYNTNQWDPPGEATFTVTLGATTNVPLHSFWVLTSNSWMSVSPSSDSSQGTAKTVTVSFVTANLAPGAYTGNIMIVSPQMANSPQLLPVTCNVAANPQQGIQVSANVEGITGDEISIPLELFSTGDVNSAGFTVHYDRRIFSSPSVELGSASSNGYLIVNTAQASSYGRVGIVVNANSSTNVESSVESFPAGLQEIAVLTLSAALNREPGPQFIGFTNTPVAQVLSDTNAAQMPNIHWGAGNVLVSAGIEGDAAPRQAGNQTNTVADWIQVGRFVAGLDSRPTMTPAEFQRADCAPRGTFGDGFLSVIDWTQVGRYVIGHDAEIPAAGPTKAFPGEQSTALLATRAEKSRLTSSGRAITIAESAIPRGETHYIDIELAARGNENGIGFTLSYDPAALDYVRAEVGEDARNANMLLNSQRVTEGLLGYAMILPVGERFARGTHHLLRIYFTADIDAPVDAADMVFTDDIVIREISSDRALALAADFEDSDVPIIGAPRTPNSLTASKGAYSDKVLVSWENVPGATQGYEVWRTPVAASRAAAARPIAIASRNTFADITAQPGQTYYYRVRAINLSGISDFSNGDNGLRRFTSAPGGATVWDFDGDAQADAYAYDSASGTWTIWLSGQGMRPLNFNLGGPGWTPVPGDYDGDGHIDPAVYNTADGEWRILASTSGHAVRTINLGGPGYTPVPADYDGDGRTDFAVYNDESGTWTARRSAYDYQEVQVNYGEQGNLPAAADFDGDGLADPALYHADSATLGVLLSGSDYQRVAVVIGEAGVGGVPVPADYDGDGLADPAIYNAATGDWYFRLSGEGYSTVNVKLGGPGYIPVPADYDGDGRTDPAVYLDPGMAEATGSDATSTRRTWLVRLSSEGYSVIQY